MHIFHISTYFGGQKTSYNIDSSKQIGLEVLISL